METLLSISETAAFFPGKGGTLFLRSIRPADPWATLGIIHGYGDHSGRHAHFMRWLAERGVACHALDLRGQGRSSGRRGFVRRWDEYLEDVDTFLALEEMKAGAPTFLLGHSHGALVLAAAVERGLRNVAGCVMTSPYFAPRHAVPRFKVLLARCLNPLVPWLRVASGLGDDMMTSDAAMRAESKIDPLVGRAATPRWYIGSVAAQERVMKEAARFQLPFLLLFGGADPIADLTAARAFYESAGTTDKTLKVYPGLLHEILRETAREEVFADVLQWLRAHQT
jgi:alpha-beta hydrolase superfamily lysophospholipase